MKTGNQLDENLLQDGLHHLLSDPSIVRNTVIGKRIQVLSPGQKNVNGGPDYLDIAILLDGQVIIGNGEYHRRSSEWLAHDHDSDEKYASVILHIVSELDINLTNEFETLLIPEDAIVQAYEDLVSREAVETPIDSLEDLQHFALIRLLRKTAEAQKLINASGLESAFVSLTQDFIGRYDSRRRRPVYDTNKLKSYVENYRDNLSFKFLSDLSDGIEISIPDSMQYLVKKKNLDEGAHLRREILLNCVLPLALCIANEESRIGLFLWFWSTPALHQYGKLARKFKDLPQNFLWQQQGMLEYIKDHGRRVNIVSESLKEYGFAEILSFYKNARAPFNAQAEE